MSLPRTVVARLSHIDPRVRAQAVDTLGRMRTPWATEAILGMFDDQSPIVRSMVALTLGMLEANIALPLLVAHLLHDPASRVRIACAAALSWMPSPESLYALSQCLSDHDERVVEIACVALGRSGNKAWVPHLRKALGHPSWYARFRACEALIAQGVIDKSVLRTLQELSSEPEADLYSMSVRKQREVASTNEGAPDDFFGRYTTDELIRLVQAETG